jgi:hypothetical protein
VFNEDHRFFLTPAQMMHRIPIPSTGRNGETGAFVGVAGTFTITITGAGSCVGVGAVENTAGTLFTSGIDITVTWLADSDDEWQVPS